MENKVVCGCYNVSENDIKNAINNGAKSFQEVQDVTNVGTGCGGCTDFVNALVSDLLLQKKIDENQMVCGCLKVKAQDVVDAINDGAKSFDQVQTVTRIATGCGKCFDSNQALVSYILKNK